MIKSMTYLSGKLFILVIFLLSTIGYAEEGAKKFVKPEPVFKQDFDWIKLTSDEWLKGDIVSMYDESLEFDSEELDVQNIDWEDVAELRSKQWQSIRMFDGTVAEGYLVIKDKKLSLTKNGITTYYNLNQLLSVASSSVNERDLWDGYVDLGFNLSNGNTAQIDYTIAAGIQRRSASSRLKADFIADYSRYKDQDTGEKIVTADNEQLTASYDWFFHPKIYFRAADFEYTADKFLNLDYRLNYGIGIGYNVIDNSQTTWDLNIGPSYQKSKFIDVQAADSEIEKSLGLTLGTDFTYEITSDIDYAASYSIQFLNEASGKRIQQFQTGLEIDLLNNFDLDLTFYADRTENPKQASDGSLPEQNDFRLVISLGYDF
ncbi:DUF481 domain-containing protein [Colwellia sp. E2M01]|uniref:DUF481 domain-containing protein n=1 Tax=Colwellia sp. E2M01 TaxID=2841561 RepID=UPI001C098A0C|nr:DUF481 domain-containing protein [Colwellia sp. E2M01]MBU2871442.1 DUF481 domain-containing protein [Colwellia sp. E2M01]